MYDRALSIKIHSVIWLMVVLHLLVLLFIYYDTCPPYEYFPRYIHILISYLTISQKY